jgi:hypothetical protein
MSRFPKFRSILAAALLVTVARSVRAEPPDISQIVSGVSAICSEGLTGVIYLDSDDWEPLVAASSGSAPSLTAAVRQFGVGRVSILGHDGFLVRDLFDNARFLKQLALWLKVRSGSKIHYSTGHSEWVTGTGLQGLAASLAPSGISVSALGSPITPARLQSVSVLIVGNAWSALTQTEVDAIRDWVAGGGGLLMAGLGWSWEDPTRGRSLDNYPMAQLATVFEARWLASTVTGTNVTNNGSAVLDRFYPAVERATVESALAWLSGAHSASGSGLPAALRSDTALVRRFLEAQQFLATAAQALPLDHPHRRRIASGLSSLFERESSFYRRDFAFQPTVDSASAWIRERAWRTWRDSIQHDADSFEDAIQIGRFPINRAALLREHGVLLLDNAMLGTEQVALLQSHFDQISWGLDGLRAVTVRDALGSAPTGWNLDGRSFGVNIFAFAIGSLRENQFPAEVPVSFADVFSTVVSHEIGHIIDASGIEGNPELRAQKVALITRAADDPTNYLRSMLEPGFFVRNPQEFFASICNQWFTSSVKTLDVALARFDAGHREPLEQFVFVADVLAGGTDTSRLFAASLDGILDSEQAQIRRDDDRQIVRIVSRTFDLWIGRDDWGRIDSYERRQSIPTDLDLNGTVDLGDAALVLLDFGPCLGCATDLDLSGNVDFGDVALVLLDFGIGR